VPHGDFAALRLTTEVFLAQSGIKAEVRSGGTVIGKQGSSLRSCLCLLRFAPTRVLPKRVRIDVSQDTEQVKVQARFDDSFAFPKLNGLVARRYEEQFDEWLRHLQGQVLPADIIDDTDQLELIEDGSNLDLEAEPEGDRSELANGTTPAIALEDLAARTTSQPPQPASGRATGHGRTAQTDRSPIIEKPIPVSDIESLPAEPVLNADAAPDVSRASLASQAAQKSAQDEAATKVPERTDEPLLQPDGTDSLVLDRPVAPASRVTLPSTGDHAAVSSVQSPQGKRIRFPRFRLWNRSKGLENIPKGGLPSQVHVLATQGGASLEAGDWTQSVHHFDAALLAIEHGVEPGTADSDSIAQIYLRRGMAHFRHNQATLDATGQIERSVSDFQIAIEATRRQVIADFDESIRLNPNQANAFFRRGEAHLFAARCERGSRRFRQASQELNQALEDLSRATELNPSFAAAFALRAIAHALLQHDEEVEADVGRAIALGADSVVVWRAIWASKSWGPKA
jgi:hypothetical protein